MLDEISMLGTDSVGVSFLYNVHLQVGEQGRLPVLILSLKEENPGKRPAVVFLHSTNKCKEWLRPLLEVAAIGFFFNFICL